MKASKRSKIKSSSLKSPLNLTAGKSHKRQSQTNKYTSPSDRDPKLLREISKFIEEGNKLKAQKLYKEALPYYHKAWQLDIERLDTTQMLAETFINIGQRDMAAKLLVSVLERDPDDPHIAGLFGLLAAKLELYDQGINCFRHQIKVNPKDVTNYVGVAGLLVAAERFQEAIEFLQSTIPLFPTHAELWNILGGAVAYTEGTEAADQFFQEAQRLDPKNATSFLNAARISFLKGEYKSAVQYFESALEREPYFTKGFLSYSQSLLGLGRLKEGWEAYEERLDPSRNTAIRWDIDLPRWQGEDLSNDSLLICGEQGLGDEIHFASLYAEMFQKAKHVHLLCDSRLIKLFTRSFNKKTNQFGVRSVSPYINKTKSGFQHRSIPFLEKLPDRPTKYIEAASIFQHTRQSLEDYKKSDGGFLIPDEEQHKKWLDRLNEFGNNLKVGFAWKSGVSNADRDAARADPAQWKDILQTPGFDFINLQYGDCTEDLKYFKDEFGVTVHHWDDIDLKNDLDQCAAITKACDIFIGWNSAPSWMAVGVGTPTLWVGPCPAWWCIGEQPKVPLYKSSRYLFPKQYADWPDVMKQGVDWLTRFRDTPKPLRADFWD